LVTVYWKAGASGNASTVANWNTALDGSGTDQAPATGDDVIFAQGGNCTWDIAGATAIPNSITLATGYTGTVTQGDVDISIGAGGYSQAAGRFTGSSNWVICQGGFAHTGGVLSAGKPNLEMSGNDTTLRLSDYDKIGKLKITGERVNFQAPVNGCEVDGVFTNTGSVVLSGTFNLPTHLLSASTIGNISGTGTLSFRYYNTNATIPAMTITCNLKIWSLDISTQNGTLTLGGAVSCNGLEVSSAHATYTITLDLAGFNLTARGITVGTRGVLLGGEGVIRNYGNFDSSAGALDAGTSQYVQAGPGTIKLAAGQSLNDLIVRSAAAGSALASNVTVNGIYAHVPDLIQGAYSLTYNKDTEYTGKRRPLRKRIVKRVVWPSLADKELLEDLEAAP